MSTGLRRAEQLDVPGYRLRNTHLDIRGLLQHHERLFETQSERPTFAETSPILLWMANYKRPETGSRSYISKVSMMALMSCSSP